MFEVLVYLFESYIHADACPAGEQLARKLSAAGFEDEEINEALDWLAGLRRVTETSFPCIAPTAGSIRIYADEELANLNPECRGFIAFLEAAKVLDATQRELIVERAMALGDFNITLNRLKVIVLMVLWQQEQPVDGLVIDELLSGDDEDWQPVLH